MLRNIWLAGSLPYRCAALGCAALLLGMIRDWPLGGGWLAAGVLAWLALLWRRPQAWLVLLPALLPVLDATPWTGRIYVDEFDCLLAATVLFHAWRTPRQSAVLEPLPALALWLVGAAALTSLFIACWPFPAPGLNSFNNYYSPYSGLRLVKGLFWALLLLPPLAHALREDGMAVRRRFALGMSLGVLSATLAVLWERAMFPGLFNFSSGYRVVGMFSGMHVGGACIEAWFAMGLPFAAWWTLNNRGWRRLGGALIFLLGSYALVVCYARGGYLASAVALTVLLGGLGLPAGRRPTPAHGRLLGRGVLLIMLLGAISLPVLQGAAMQRRYAASARDLDLRLAHWADGMRLIDADPLSRLFGMGVGSYPRLHFQHSGERLHAASYGLEQAGGKTWLQLSGGSPVYVEQLVNVQARRRYTLSFRARALQGSPMLALPVCEKWMLYSFNCIWHQLRVPAGQGWQDYRVEFGSGVLPQRRWLGDRPVKLSLVNLSGASIAAIDDISLRADDGRELLANGGFEAGMDHWLSVGDIFLPWHLENWWLQLAFEQGVFGVLAHLLLAACVAGALLRLRRSRDRAVPALAALLAAFLTLSAIDSLSDFPRISFIFYLATILALLQSRQGGTPQSAESVKYYLQAKKTHVS